MKKILCAVCLSGGVLSAYSGNLQHPGEMMLPYPQHKPAERFSFDIPASTERMLKSPSLNEKPQSPLGELEKTLLRAAKANDDQAVLDSIVTVDAAGKNLSKQLFTYNQRGQLTLSENYVALDNGEWIPYSRYVYEFDELGRPTLRAIEGPADYPYEDCRYEYFYNDDSDNYSELIFSAYSEGSNSLEPVQRGLYEYDPSGYPTRQEFYQWNYNTNSWVGNKRIDATFDEQGRLTSVFYYVWSFGGNDWIGEENITISQYSQTYAYTPDGQDAEICYYRWNDGQWNAYKKEAFTYDELNQLLRIDHLYYNPERGDWSGDAIGEWGLDETNWYIEYAYNDDRSIAAELVYRAYVNRPEDFFYVGGHIYDYKELENGGRQESNLTVMSWQEDTPTPYREQVIQYNKYGLEFDYTAYACDGDARMPIDQRHVEYMDDIVFKSAGYYAFNSDGSRYGTAYEDYLFPDDFNSTSEFWTPYEGLHYIGTSHSTDTEWKLHDSWEAEYAFDDDFSYLATFDYSYDVKIRQLAESIVYDLDLMSDEVIAMPGVFKSIHPYRTHTLYFNNDWFYGKEDHWTDISTDIYYIIGGKTSVAVVAGEVSEVARFDISGNRLSGPAVGINIVKYSDGSVRKVMVK